MELSESFQGLYKAKHYKEGLSVQIAGYFLRTGSDGPMFPEVLARLSDDWLGIRRTALGELVCALEAGALSVNQRQQILQKVSERWARFDGPLIRNLCPLCALCG